MRSFLTTLILLVSINSFSQQIHGTIQDENGDRLPSMIIALKDVQDSTFVTGSVSDENGEFEVACDVNGKRCFLEISGLGYRTKRMSVESFSGDASNVVVTMEEDSKELDEVMVVGKRKVIYKNGEYKLSVSGTSLENQPDIFSVLSFLPFVTTNKENVSIMGKGNILIMLNGREVKSMSEISRLNPSQIKEMSIAPHASSVYGAEYDAVIKIKTVSDIKDYLSSQVKHSSVFAKDYSNSQTADVNFKKGRWNCFGSYTFKHLATDESATNQFAIYNTENQTLLGNNRSLNKTSSISNNHNVILSSSYSFNERNSLELQYVFDSNHGTNNTDVTETSSFMDNDETTLNTIQRNANNNSTHNIVLKYLLSTDLYSLTVNGGYINSVSRVNNDIKNDSKPYAYIDGRNKYDVYTLNVDFAKSFSSACKIQIGTKHSYIVNNGYSLAKYDVQQGVAYDNSTRLHDGVSAVYASVSGQAKKLFYEGGVRGEYAASRYEDNTSEQIKRHYFNVFPSLSLTWSATPSFVVSGGYVVKGIRPTFSEISPLIRYVNTHLYEQGTPSLKHMISHNPYLTMVIKNKISLDINYFHKTNFAMYVFGQMSAASNILVNKPINVNVNYWTIRASYSDKFGVYRFAYNGEIHYDQTKIPFQNNSGLSNKPRFSASLVNQFDITNHLMLFCNLDLASKYTSLGSTFSDSYNITVGAYATFFKDKRLTVIISGNDLLQKGLPDNNSCHYSIESARTLHPDNRNLTISARYNINSYRSLFKRNNANSDERLRIK